MMTDLRLVSERIRNLRLMHSGGISSPHKLLFLVALARLYERNPQRENAFPLDNRIENEFCIACREFFPTAKPDSLKIEYPFYHLTKDNIWSLTLRKGREALFQEYESDNRRRLTRSRLQETTEHGKLDREFDHCLRKPEDREALLSLLKEMLNRISNETPGRTVATVCTGDDSMPKSGRDGCFNSAEANAHGLATEGGQGNPFVSYLNSMQRLSASNENALAEFQACNPLFPRIHVPHPLKEVIFDELKRTDGRQVILTGHAGDGKSTIALAVYRKLLGLEDNEIIQKQPFPREDLPGDISILKDLSERRRSQDAELMQEIIGRRRRFLIVSNTGALLDFFRSQEAVHSVSSVKIESDILSAIRADSGQGELLVAGTSFLVINLARIDNLEIAKQIFTRMIDPANWTVCNGLPCRSNCPICMNVDLINHSRVTILDRLFLAYRRMYEYGTRLTLRQITEHLAYLITSGLEEADIAEMRAKGLKPLKAEFMFFNRFFGDDGKVDHAPALQMRAVHEIRRQDFGERPCPTWERRLWLNHHEGNFHLGVDDCDTEFELLRAHGAGSGDGSHLGMTPDQAREQVRRMLFFLYDFSDHGTSFLNQFLNSPSIFRWQDWQRGGKYLQSNEKSILEQQIFHVLQEHFTGVRLPEGSRGRDRRLYITLSRGKGEIRQSAQVVIAQLDWSRDFSLELVTQKNVAGSTRTDLELQGRERIKAAKMKLTLPFLDYVLMRHFGEVGETLQAAYVERLECFKAQIQDLAVENPAHVMLVRLKTDHTFRRQQFAIREGKLEVNDVL